MHENNQKDFDSLTVDTVNIVNTLYTDNESQYFFIKMFNSLRRKINTKTKKISSNDINDLREVNSDNESDKTQYEKKCPSNTSRKTNSVISNNSSKSDASTNTDISNSSSKSNNKTKKYTSKSLYRKREKSIDYVRNNDNDETTDYNVVLTYQKYIPKPKRTLSSGTLFDASVVRRRLQNKHQ